MAPDERSADTRRMIDPDGFAARFAEQRRKLNVKHRGLFTFEYIAERLGIRYQSAQAYEKGSVPRRHRWEEICDVMETTVEELFYGQEAPNSPPGIEQSHAFDVSSGPIIDIRDRVPIIPWSWAGNWQSARKTLHPGDAEGWLYTIGRVSEMAFAVKATGDAMTSATDKRSVTDGTYVVFDPAIEATHDRLVLARFPDGRKLLRLFWVDGDSRLLKPLNDKYPLLDLTPDVDILGVMVQSTKLY